MFPPRRGKVLVPVASRRAALAGLSLYTPCTRKGMLVQRLAWEAVSVLGPAVLPGRTAEWEPPTEPEVWENLAKHWRKVAGSFDQMAIYYPAQVDRPRAAFTLLADGRPRAFVKLRRGEGEVVANEATALDQMWNFSPCAFRVPRLAAYGNVGEWYFLVMETLAIDRHVPAWRAPLEQVIGEIQEGLRGMPRPHSVPSHWEPKHGDLAVWNLRRSSRYGLVLIDWEHAGWGPPRSDEVFFRVMAAALRGRSPQPMQGVDEAVDFWRQQPQFQLGPAENPGNEFVRRAQATLYQMGQQ